MHWRIAALGKPRLPWAAEGIQDYLHRLSRFSRIETRWLPAGSSQMEEKSLLEASSGCVRLVLDERGRSLRSLELAAQIQNWETSSVRHVALLVGGGDGLTESIRQQADLVWSLSCGTLQHELALLVACEQIYRAYSILRKHPYHREGQVR